MPEKQHRRPSLRIDPSDLALEVVSIVIAIVLATAVGQIVANYQAGGRTREALAQIRQEVAHDHQRLQEGRPLHRQVRAAFDATIRKTHLEQLDFDEFVRTFHDAAPTGYQPFGGTTTAWDLARSSNALSDLPYALRATLQTRYAELAQLRELNTALYARLTTTPAEGRPNFYFTAVALASTLADLVASEERLARDDDTVMSALDARGIR